MDKFEWRMLYSEYRRHLRDTVNCINFNIGDFICCKTAGNVIYSVRYAEKGRHKITKHRSLNPAEPHELTWVKVRLNMQMSREACEQGRLKHGASELD